MADDDWRLRIELGGHGAGGLLARLSRLGGRHLAHELEADRLVVSHDEDTVFVYAASQAQLDKARPAIEARARASSSIEPREVVFEHWLDDEDRWDSEPAGSTIEEETVADRLRAVGGADPLQVAPRGARARRPARAGGLRRRAPLVVRDRGHGDARGGRRARGAAARRGRAGRRARVGATPRNPFAVFGGLGSDGTPLSGTATLSAGCSAVSCAMVLL